MNICSWEQCEQLQGYDVRPGRAERGAVGAAGVQPGDAQAALRPRPGQRRGRFLT